MKRSAKRTPSKGRPSANSPYSAPKQRAPLKRVLLFAVLYAFALPYASNLLFDVPVWRGMVPVLIPGFVGGDVPPAW